MIMTDCDPYGLDICMMYKYDSLAIAWAVEYLLKNIFIYPCSDISRLSIMPSSIYEASLCPGL